MGTTEQHQARPKIKLFCSNRKFKGIGKRRHKEL